VLGEIAGAAPTEGVRMPGIESIYEYGSRVGFWRLYELFTQRGVPLTVFGVTQVRALYYGFAVIPYRIDLK
jgi:peptidoglycan/xylan/chitin deacetylase (PgdA/CDA1 family)